ncbi:hypothetical protein C8R42DRAFT_421871 [Lentinula raphanica]|nr:hypothetical protein C8R42DRAFT_421871 [Lentinula raphanica]
MLTLAWLLVCIAFVVQAVLSVEIDVATNLTVTVSAQVTATWILQNGDRSLSDGFSMVLVRDDHGEFTEWATVITPSGGSIGIIQPTPTMTGSHRFEVFPLQTGSSSAGSSSPFQVDSLFGKNDPSTDNGSPSNSSSNSNSNSTSGSITSTPRPNPTSTPQANQPYVVAITVSAVLGTILLMLILLALLLFIRRRRRHSKIPSHSIDQHGRWYRSQRYHWSSPQRSRASRDNSGIFETSKTVPMSVWEAPGSWNTPIAPSDSVSRLLSLKQPRDLQQESVLSTRMQIRLTTGDRMKGMISSEVGTDSDVGTAIVEETKWVHAGGAELIPQIQRASSAINN